MNRRRFLFSSATAAGLWAAAPALHAQSGPRKDRHVVLISIDGFAAYSLKDPKLPVPHIRALMARGAYADAMEPVNPTVTWPNHTSMVTGVFPAKHQVLFNGLNVRPGEGQPLRIEPWIDKPELVKAKTVYDAAHEGGLTTAEIDWVAIHNAKTINWTFPERPRLTDPVVQELIAAGALSQADVEGWQKFPITWKDEVWTLAAQHMIRKYRPNLLMLHWLTTDSSQHTYGARSLAGNAALALADSKVGRVEQALRDAGIWDRTTLIIVSDHGFKTYKQTVHVNAAFRQKGWIRDKEGKPDADVWVIPEGGSALVYILRRSPELEQSLPQFLRQLPGVARVITESEFSALGYPQPNDRMANYVLAAAEGYAFGGTHTGETVIEARPGSTPGSHGYMNDDRDMDAIFVAAGAGIRKGGQLGRIRSVDVAPTIAHLLGVPLPSVDGKALVCSRVRVNARLLSKPQAKAI